MASSLRQLPDVLGTEPIDILLSNDGRGDGVLGDVVGEWKLDEDAVDRVVIVQLGDLLKQLRLSNFRRQMDEFAKDPGLGFMRLLAPI